MNAPTRLILHPLFFAAFPIIFLYGLNFKEVGIVVAFLTMVAVIILGAVLWGTVNILIKDVAKSAIIASLYIILFFSYGQIHSWLFAGDILLRQRYLLPLWLSACVLFTVFLLRIRAQNQITILSSILNVVAFSLVAVNSLMIGFNVINHKIVVNEKVQDELIAEMPVEKSIQTFITSY